jgi:peroxiredoxin
MRILSIGAILVLLFTACSEDNHNFKLKIILNGKDRGTIFLARRSLTGTIPVDSAKPDKSGTCKLEGYTRQPDFYIVYRSPKHYINLIIKPGDDFRIRADAASFEYTYMVEGSKDSRLIQKLVTMQAKTLKEITEISTEYENSKGEPGFEKARVRIDTAYKKIVEEHKTFSKKLIEENPGSLAGLMALYQQLGRDIPVFDYKTDFRYYEMVDSSLASLYPGSEAIKDLDKKVTELRNLLRTEKGSVAPGIELPDLSGKLHSLHSLQGKYVILVFWASWSSQSCAEITKLNQICKPYSGKNLELFMVSLDRSRDSWQKRVDELKASGIQVSDLRYWDSPVVETYRINQLPVLYLLDKDGKIRNKDFTTADLPGIFGNIPDLHGT